MDTDIKTQIQQDLFRSDGKLNTAVIRQHWFYTSVLYNAIHDATVFLPSDAPVKERIWCILHDITSTPLCTVCSTAVSFNPSANKGYNTTCSNPTCKGTASYTKALNTKYQKYGALVSEKTRRAASNRSAAFVEKSRQTMMTRYGVDNPGQLPTHNDKRIRTISDRYDATSVGTIPSVKASLYAKRMTIFQKMSHHVTILSVHKRTKDRRSLYNIEFNCNTCSETHTVYGETFKWRAANNYNPCPKCSGIESGSIGQRELYDFVSTMVQTGVEYNNRSILNGKELDIYIPSHKIAIEYNGLFWHSYDKVESTEERNKHLLKTLSAKEHGITLIHVFEHEWIQKRTIVESRLRSILGMNRRIYARCCEVRAIDNTTANNFMAVNHIQGKTHCDIAIGLYDQDQLLACMTFGKPRYSKSYQYELLRFCSSQNTNVVGGASKIFKFFTKHYHPESVISYADRRWTVDALYAKLGFCHTHDSAPSYYYFKSQEGLKLFNRRSFQKHTLSTKLNKFDATITEAENMFNNGYRRIWDCGNRVWRWEAPSR